MHVALKILLLCTLGRIDADSWSTYPHTANQPTSCFDVCSFILEECVEVVQPACPLFPNVSIPSSTYCFYDANGGGIYTKPTGISIRAYTTIASTNCASNFQVLGSTYYCCCTSNPANSGPGCAFKTITTNTTTTTTNVSSTSTSSTTKASSTSASSTTKASSTSASSTTKASSTTTRSTTSTTTKNPSLTQDITDTLSENKWYLIGGGVVVGVIILIIVFRMCCRSAPESSRGDYIPLTGSVGK